MRRLAAPQGRIVFVILRTACSPPVAPHPASQRRSYLRLPESGIIPEEDFHLLNRACSQAHSFRRRPESSQTMVVYKSYYIGQGRGGKIIRNPSPSMKERLEPAPDLIRGEGEMKLVISHHL